MKIFLTICLVLVSTYAAFISPLALCEAKRRISTAILEWPEYREIKEQKEIDAIGQVLAVNLPELPKVKK